MSNVKNVSEKVEDSGKDLQGKKWVITSNVYFTNGTEIYYKIFFIPTKCSQYKFIFFPN